MTKTILSHVNNVFIYGKGVHSKSCTLLFSRKILMEKAKTDKSVTLLAGLAGFEPANVGVKVLCLTPWR